MLIVTRVSAGPGQDWTRYFRGMRCRYVASSQHESAPKYMLLCCCNHSRFVTQSALTRIWHGAYKHLRTCAQVHYAFVLMKWLLPGKSVKLKGCMLCDPLFALGMADTTSSCVCRLWSWCWQSISEPAVASLPRSGRG